MVFTILRTPEAIIFKQTPKDPWVALGLWYLQIRKWSSGMCDYISNHTSTCGQGTKGIVFESTFQEYALTKRYRTTNDLFNKTSTNYNRLYFFALTVG